MESQSQSSTRYDATIDIIGGQLTKVYVNLPNGSKTFTTNAKVSGNPLGFSGQLSCKSPDDLSGTKPYRMDSNGKFISINIGITDPRSATFQSEELEQGNKPRGAGNGTWE
ncbi:unnamed protein product [Rhizoctonia solani]|uniref:Uncharacterized protein n=1 Tax=Rhizoctonia solani TaxID=456999 RepID=A0A8H3CD77_9AGAM|nr:unnamed protein product [Rhizoctonia solani]